MRCLHLTVLAAGIVVAASLSPVAADASASATSTATTLTSSVASSTYDATVTLKARVTAISGTPDGSVTFTDTSNGSVLDTTTLSNGVAVFSTSALAAGARTIVATYSGSSDFTPSGSAAVPITVAAGRADAVTYQIDSRHDGDQVKNAPNASSLHRLWNVALGAPSGFMAEAGDVSYPVIAGGRSLRHRRGLRKATAAPSMRSARKAARRTGRWESGARTASRRLHTTDSMCSS